MRKLLKFQTRLQMFTNKIPVAVVHQEADGDVSLSSNKQNPWPYLNRFFECIGLKDQKNNLEYQCLLCKPLRKKLSCCMTSMNNLKKHVKSSHPTLVKKLQNAIDDQKRKHIAGKRKAQSEEVAQTSAKKVLLQTSLTDNRLPRSRSRQEVYENKVSVF